MKNLLKSTYRIIKRIRLKRNGIYVSHSTLFNRQTSFGGHNKIGKDSIISGTKLGKYTYIGANSVITKAIIGSFCSIGKNVQVVVETHPSRGYISTSPVFYSTLLQCGKSFTDKQLFDEHLSIEDYSIIIGNDVWIGNDVKLLGGIKIGDGAIIGLGAVVTKSIPPYAVVGGVPAKIIRYRFDAETITELLNTKWWEKDDEWILNYMKTHNCQQQE